MSAELHTPVSAAVRPAKDYEWPKDNIQDHNKSQLRNPIILLSVCPRSGSNYLEALLSLHLHCRKSRLPEDFFLANSETLLNFCRSVAESWDDWWPSIWAGHPAWQCISARPCCALPTLALKRKGRSAIAA